MRTVIGTAVGFVAMFVLPCVLLSEAFTFFQGRDIRWMPRIWVSLIPLFPLFFSFLASQRLHRNLQRALTMGERVALVLILVVGMGCVAALCEARMIYSIYGKAVGIGFDEILFAPFAERYSLGREGGLSFTVKALLASLAAGLIFIPVRLQRLLQASAAQTREGDQES